MYVLAKAGRPQQRAWIEAWQKSKKLTPEDLLLFDEEAHIRNDRTIGATGDSVHFSSISPVILHRYPGTQIYLILDNAKIHRAQVLAPFLADCPARHLLFLPPRIPRI